jgi:hypothetical protein
MRPRPERRQAIKNIMSSFGSLLNETMVLQAALRDGSADLLEWTP